MPWPDPLLPEGPASPLDDPPAADAASLVPSATQCSTTHQHLVGDACIADTIVAS